MHDVAVGVQGPSPAEAGPAKEEQGQRAAVSPHELLWAVEAEAHGEAGPAQVALLEAHRLDWRLGLQRLLRETDANLGKVRNLPGPERDQVVADFEAEAALLSAALDRLLGVTHEAVEDRTRDGPGEVRLQASLCDGRSVVWAACPGAGPADDEELGERLSE